MPRTSGLPVGARFNVGISAGSSEIAVRMSWKFAGSQKESQ